MAKRIREVNRDFLKAVPLPVQTNSYTVISHESVMNYVFAELANQGFSILSEEYRCTHDGLIAQGIYKLNYNSDEEMSLMFAWSNSYNKQLKFKCVTGGYVSANQTVMLCGEIGVWTRKHTGTADADAIEMIKTQITNAKMYYNNLIADKEVMKQIPLTTKRQAEILGVLFAEYELLTTEQASIVRQQMDKPSFFYNGGKHTLWSFYNHVTVAFQQSHPKSWMEDQRMLHWFISNEFDLTGSPVVSPIVQALQVTETMVDPLDNNYGQPENQTNLLTQIAEVTGDVSVLEPQLDSLITEDFNVTLEDGTEVQYEIASDGTVESITMTYIDPVGNTFEAPVVEEEEITEAIERVERKELKETLKKEDQKGKLPSDIQSRLDAFNAKREAESSILTPEEQEEEYELKHTDDYQDVIEQRVEVELEATVVNTTTTQEVTNDDFSFDLGSDDDDVKFDDDFL